MVVNDSWCRLLRCCLEADERYGGQAFGLAAQFQFADVERAKSSAARDKGILIKMDGNGTVPPYTEKWDIPGPGCHSFRVVAVDAAGNESGGGREYGRFRLPYQP
jgi:hypothetical protein